MSSNVPDGWVWARFELDQSGKGNATWHLGWKITWCDQDCESIVCQLPRKRWSEPRHIPIEWVKDGTVKICDGCMATFVAKQLAPGHVHRQDVDRDVPTTASEIMDEV